MVNNTKKEIPEVSGVTGGATGPLQRFPFVEDLSEYEEEEGKEEGTMTKAVVVHGVPINWRKPTVWGGSWGRLSE